MNVKLTVEYDGTDYHGWQVQPNAKTIQGVLEDAFRVVLRQPVRLRAAGRTDAGVHARGQVANFFCTDGVDLQRLKKGVNAITPKDLALTRLEAAAPSFDARRDARMRIYEYHIWNSSAPSVFLRRYAFQVRQPLCFSAIEEAIPALEGEHDFSSFQAAGCGAVNPVRRVHRNILSRSGERVVYRVEANGYLRHMVRNIVGTLVEVGLRQRSPGVLQDLLALRDRTRAGPTAPAHGLFLVEVRYD